MAMKENLDYSPLSVFVQLATVERTIFQLLVFYTIFFQSMSPFAKYN